MQSPTMKFLSFALLLCNANYTLTASGTSITPLDAYVLLSSLSIAANTPLPATADTTGTVTHQADQQLTSTPASPHILPSFCAYRSSNNSASAKSKPVKKPKSTSRLTTNYPKRFCPKIKLARANHSYNTTSYRRK